MNPQQGPLSFTDIVDRSFGFVRTHFRRLYAIPLVLVIPLAFLTGYGQGRAQYEFVPARGDFPLAVFGVIYGFMFLYILGQGIATLASYNAAGRLLDGAPLTIGAAYRAAIQARVLATTLLASVVVFVGLIFCIAPGILLLLYFAFVIPVLYEERLWGTRALGRSLQLVRYNPEKRFVRSTTLKVFLLGVIIFVVGYAVNFLVTLPFVVAGMVKMFRSVAAGGAVAPFVMPAWLLAVQNALTAACNGLIGLYSAAAFTMLYRDTRERMEGRDLEAGLAARLAGTEPAAPDGPSAVP